MTSQTQPITPMKRAGQLIAHLGILHQISDVRQLLLLQLVMQGRQDQVALFRREQDTVTLNLIGSQPQLTSQELTHRAGNVPAAQLFSQLQTLSGIQGNDVAFSNTQIGDVISARTRAIEASDELASLDAVLSTMVARAVQDATLNPSPDRTPVQNEATAAPEAAPETQTEGTPGADGRNPDTTDSQDSANSQDFGANDFDSRDFDPEDVDAREDENLHFSAPNDEKPFVPAEEFPAETEAEHVTESVSPDDDAAADGPVSDETASEVTTPAQTSSRRGGRKAS